MTKKDIRAIARAWTEMNIIRARDGVPYTHHGTKSDITQEYWDIIMKDLNNIVLAETNQSAWLHPTLYDQNIDKK